MEADLIDEYRLIVHPAVIGTGQGIFQSLQFPAALEVVRTIQFPSGAMAYVFNRVGSEVYPSFQSKLKLNLEHGT